MVRIDVGSPEKENYYAIEFRQDPVTNEIRGYRFINDQWEEGSYPLKPLKGKQIDSLSGVESLIQEKFEPIISKKREVKWIIPSFSSESASSGDVRSSSSSSTDNLQPISGEQQMLLHKAVTERVAIEARLEIYLIQQKLLAGEYVDEVSVEERIEEALLLEKMIKEAHGFEEGIDETALEERIKTTLHLERSVKEAHSLNEKIEKLPLEKIRKRELAAAIEALKKPLSSYRRTARSRSGGTDPIIINTLKEYIEAGTLPEDEKKLLRNTLEMLSPRTAIVAEGNSPASSIPQIVSPRIHQGQEEFLKFIVLRKERGTYLPEIEYLEERFNVLTENSESFRKRNREEIYSILSSFSTFKKDSKVTLEVVRVMKILESKSLSPDKLALLIKGLGVEKNAEWKLAFEEYCHRYCG